MYIYMYKQAWWASKNVPENKWCQVCMHSSYTYIYMHIHIHIHTHTNMYTQMTSFGPTGLVILDMIVNTCAHAYTHT